MADWVLVPCLVKLRSEFNEIAPDRDKRSDGSIGDDAHADTSSDHNPDETGSVPIRDSDRVNEVHAIDVDQDLRVPGLTLDRVVALLVLRCREGAERRLRYIIFDRTIWSASNGWKPLPYNGSNPHIEHAHFSASYTSAHEASTASWHLREALPMTAPTPQQNATAVAAHDVDPGAGSQTLGGGVWTLLTRSDYLGNEWAPKQRQLLVQLDARVQDQGDDLDGLGAALALVVSLLDPEKLGEVVRAAVAAELDARGIVNS